MALQGIRLKKVTENDLQNLMEWRMRPDITRHLMTDVKLTMEMQRAWFEKLKTDDTQMRWVIWCGDTPVGSMHLLNIDHRNKNAEFGLFVAEKGLLSLKDLLHIHWNLYEYIFGETDINRLYAYNMEGNSGIVRFSKSHGCEVEGTMRQHVFKNGRFYDITIVAITKERWLEIKDSFDYPKIEIER